jgi:hypothetical protein
LFARLALTPGGRACCSRDVGQCYSAVEVEVLIARVQLCQSVLPLLSCGSSSCHQSHWLCSVCRWKGLLSCWVTSTEELYGSPNAVPCVCDAPVFVMAAMVLVLRHVGVPSEGVWRLRMPA